MSSKLRRKSPSRKSKKYLFEEVIGVLKENSGKSLNYKQISAYLGISDHSQKMLVNAILDDLVSKDLVLQPERGKFRWKSTFKALTGKVEMITSGAAYIVSEDSEQDIYVPANKLHGALHGDIVNVKVYRSREGKRKEGEIEEVLKRSKSEVVGTLKLSGKFAFLIPDNPKFGVDVYIPKESFGGGTDGQKVVAKIVEYPENGNPIGEVIRVLGNAGDHETEIHAILEEFGLPYEFPSDVIRLSELIPRDITSDEISKRRDFRSITTFTIDPYDAKDFDDALSIRKLENGFWEIGVHIADVSHYLREGSIIDKEGFARATSVYLVDRTVPMLPEVLSNDLCSLRPNEDKLCFSAVFQLDDEAKIQHEWFGRTIIHSIRRFTYEEAQEVIETGKGDHAEEILTLNRLAKRLRKDRFRKGSIAFEKVEVKFKLDGKGNPGGILFKHMKDSNQLIEDFMLLANRRVAEIIGAPKGNIPRPFVYRIHANPDPEKLANFSEFVSKFGYKMNTKNDKAIAESFNKLMEDVAGKPEANAIEMLAIRTMAKAVYSVKNIGHYGLGFQYYTHFTSPIRRYPDVMVHRLLDHYLKKGAPVKEDALELKCKHSSEREKLASDAERASIKYMQVKFLQDKIGQEFDGVVSGVTEWGIFVEIIENLCEGMVRLRDMEDDFYYYEEDHYRIIGKRFRKTYTLGDKVRIEVKRADLIKKQLDFRITDNPIEEEKNRNGKREEGNVKREKGNRKRETGKGKPEERPRKGKPEEENGKSGEQKQSGGKDTKSVRDEWGFEV